MNKNKKTMKMPKPIQVKVRGTPYSVLEYKNVDGWTVEEIEIEAQRVSNELAKKGYRGGIEIGLYYPQYEYPNHITQIGHNVDVRSHSQYYDDPEPDLFYSFTIYIIKNIFMDQGGTDLYNDCFYALSSKIGN